MSVSITFWDWLLLSSRELVALGVPAHDVVCRRFEQTGHVRALDRAWARAFGCWGGVEAVDEIAGRVGRTTVQVRQYAKDAGLRPATRQGARSHAELALLLWCDRANTPAASCARFGVWPGERRLLCTAMQVIIEGAGEVEPVLGWTVGKLEREFADLAVPFRPPTRLLAALAQGTPNDAC